MRAGYIVNKGGIAKVEKCMCVHFGLVEHAVQDFQFGDAFSREMLYPSARRLTPNSQMMRQKERRHFRYTARTVGPNAPWLSGGFFNRDK